VRILLASPIDADALAMLSQSHDVVTAFNSSESELCAVAVDREALVFRSGVTISSNVIDAAPDLRFLIRAGSGLDNVDVEHARRRGIRLVRIPGPSARVVAEFTFALMLDLARNVSLADRLLRQGHWPKNALLGTLLRGKTLGIVGAGNIGSQVGELAAAWSMNSIGCVKNPSPAVAAALELKGTTLTPLETVLETADFVTIHVPLDDSTRHLIDGPALARMKPGAILLNLARGGVVDEDALLSELTNGGRLAGAALDVHEQEGEGTISQFANLPNVVLTPHIGAMAGDSQMEIGRRLVEIVGLFSNGSAETHLRDEEFVL
jgi:phosphoglycerate dehydrogenase-like enzyme